MNFDKLLLSLQRITRSGNYRPEVDGLRFIAIAIVLVGHFTERSLRFYGRGVDSILHDFLSLIAVPASGVLLFFAISSFIIASQFQRRKVDFPTYLRGFFVRRVSRIYPPYLIVIVATWLILLTTGIEIPGLRRLSGGDTSLNTSFIASVFYANGLALYEYPKLFGPGWSLEIEIQFYIIAPFLLASYFLCKNKMARLVIGFAILLVSMAFNIAIFEVSRSESVIWWTVAAYFPYFWLGILLVDVGLRRIDGRWGVVADVLAWLGVALLFYSPHLDAGWMKVFVRVASIAMIFVGSQSGGSFQRVISYGAIPIIGGACYSIYLLHLQIFHLFYAALHRVAPNLGLGEATLLGLLLVVPAMLAVSMTFYAVVERPFMQPTWNARVAGLFNVGALQSTFGKFSRLFSRGSS